MTDFEGLGHFGVQCSVLGGEDEWEIWEEWEI
jgi:hypothetical protein